MFSFALKQTKLVRPVVRALSTSSKTEGAILKNAFLRSVGATKPQELKNKDNNTPPVDILKNAKPQEEVVKATTPVENQSQVKPISGNTNVELSPAAQAARDFYVNPDTTANLQEFAPRICVIGVGGGGCNAINNMVARGLSGVEFICTNTDAQHLSTTLTDKRIQLGRGITEGLGCGANPDVGRAAAEESRAEIEAMIGDAHMVFITAGMGGGTGTGAASVIAEICMERGILTVAVVTKPFTFEGRHRARLAAEGMRALQDRTDTLIVIPNQNLFKMIDDKTTVMNAFGLADDVLLAGVKSITDLMVRPGLINLDFADVQAVMAGMGNAIMGTGQAEGEDRAVRAAADALKNPLLGGDCDVTSAKGMLVNITGGADLTLFEVDHAAQHITKEIKDKDANIIFGSSFDPTLDGSIRVSIVATGIDQSTTE
jgi:cell division protein FtsZ